MASGGRGAELFRQECLNCTEQGFVVWRDFTLAGSELVMHTRLLLGGEADLAWLAFGGTWVPLLTVAVWALLLSSGLALLLRRDETSTTPLFTLGTPSTRVEDPAESGLFSRPP
jgi:hypothetical protein